MVGRVTAAATMGAAANERVHHRAAMDPGVEARCMKAGS
jgi:hypothetical protein